MRKQAFILFLAALLLVLAGATAAEMSKGKKKQATTQWFHGIDGRIY